VKKTIAIAFVAVAVMAAVLVYRAVNTFHDLQLPPAEGITEITIDEVGAIAHFSEALRIPTISHDDRNNFDAQAFLDFHDFLRAAYPLVHRYTQRSVIAGYSLVYRLPGTDPSLEPVLFMSHIDVVPVEEATRDQWTQPPFGGVVSDGTIWGRGALDVKLGVISLMEALEKMLSEGVSPQRDIYLSFGHDEEVGGRDGAAQIAAYFAGKGTRFDYVIDEGGAVTDGLIKVVSQPVAVIGLAEKGYVNIVLTVDASGGHSSSPPAQTAIGILSRAIVRVEDNPFPAKLDYFNQNFTYLGAHTPFRTRLFMANQWLFAPLIKRQLLADMGTAAGLRTTAAATMISGSPKANILPKRSRAVINFRIFPGETVESVIHRVTALIDDDRVSVSAEYGIDPSPASPADSRGFGLIAATIRGMDENILVAPYLLQGGTDAKYFYALSENVYRFLMFRATPESLNRVHGIDEQVPVEEFLQAIRFYYHLIRQSMEA
jgi:carboxypeptidase PM20D1